MSEARVLVCAVLLAAGVAAAVAAGVTRMAVESGPQVASVRIAELAAEHAERAARTGASADGIRASTRAWAAALERALGDIAGQHRMVLLPARAVAAGAPDLTDLVRLMVEDRLRHATAGKEAGP